MAEYFDSLIRRLDQNDFANEDDADLAIIETLCDVANNIEEEAGQPMAEQIAVLAPFAERPERGVDGAIKKMGQAALDAALQKLSPPQMKRLVSLTLAPLTDVVARQEDRRNALTRVNLYMPHAAQTVANAQISTLCLFMLESNKNTRLSVYPDALPPETLLGVSVLRAALNGTGWRNGVEVFDLFLKEAEDVTLRDLPRAKALCSLYELRKNGSFLPFLPPSFRKRLARLSVYKGQRIAYVAAILGESLTKDAAFSPVRDCVVRQMALVPLKAAPTRG